MALTNIRTAQLLRSQSLEYRGDVKGSRNIVVAIDNTEQQKTLQWACTLYRPGDIFHCVHVAKVLSPQDEVFHGVVGTSLRFRENSLAEAQEAINRVKAWWKLNVKAPLEEKGIPFVAHFFVDTSNAPSDVIAQTIAKVADEVDAAYIVVAKSNKTFFEKRFVGSVAGTLPKYTDRSLFMAV